MDCRTQGAIVDLSEQFLYWATKAEPGEPQPGTDGTWIEFATPALASKGICEETVWPYAPVLVPGNPGHGGGGNPFNLALQRAPSRATPGNYTRCNARGHAARIRTLLENGPVAISLPVFSDPVLPPDSNNWVGPLGELYGWVADPVPTSIVTGGHAVCLTGYQPDPDAPGGGYFIVRNSWGNTLWGGQLPSPDYFGPEPGYGQVSVWYVDEFAWEYCQL